MIVSADHLKALSPAEFEVLIAQLLEAGGFRNVIGLAGTGDEGIDLRAEWLEELPTGGSRLTIWAVQCKRYAKPLGPEEIHRIIGAALQPPLDLLPARPDFFLIAASSGLTVNARRVVERANHERTKYGCTFIVWDGEEIARKVNAVPTIVERFWQQPVPPAPAAFSPLVARLTVLLDHVGDTSVLTFLYDPGQNGSLSQVTRSELPSSQMDRLIEDVTRMAYAPFSDVKAVGERLHALLPPRLLESLRQDDVYVRLASNAHILPFELAYDSATEEFLGDARRIGRIHIAESLATLPPVRLPSFLLIGADATADGLILPMVSAELDRLSAVLNNQGVSLSLLAGSRVTRQNLATELDRQQPTVIHFAGHALTGSAEVPRLLLNDGDVPLNELLSQSVEGTLVFLSACSTGVVLNEFSRLLFERAGSSLVGFVAQVSDEAASVLAIRFYEEIVAGATLGDAVRAARRHQREVSPDDHAWASLVLFGDPTIRLFPNATSSG